MNCENFSYEKKSTENGTTLLLAGTVDERTDLKAVFSDIQGPVLTVALKDVSRMNSSGVRNWINTIKSLPNDLQINFVECSRAIVDQLNMITNFFSSGTLVSFYAPYYCNECDDEKAELLEIEKHFGGGETEAPDLPCPSCGKPMKMNEDEDKYLAFLAS